MGWGDRYVTGQRADRILGRINSIVTIHLRFLDNDGR